MDGEGRNRHRAEAIPTGSIGFLGSLSERVIHRELETTHIKAQELAHSSILNDKFAALFGDTGRIRYGQVAHVFFAEATEIRIQEKLKVFLC